MQVAPNNINNTQTECDREREREMCEGGGSSRNLKETEHTNQTLH